MANPNDEFWLFCVILCMIVSKTILRLIQRGMKIVRKNYRSRRVLVSKEDFRAYNQRG